MSEGPHYRKGDFVEFKSRYPGCVWQVNAVVEDDRSNIFTGYRVRYCYGLILTYVDSRDAASVPRKNKAWAHQLRQPSNPLLILALEAQSSD